MNKIAVMSALALLVGTAHAVAEIPYIDQNGLQQVDSYPDEC